jgi:hypothetical protein
MVLLLKSEKRRTQMAFEIYHPRMRAKEGPKPIVRLSKSSLVLNKVAREALASPEYVELAFDKDTNSICIRLSAKPEGIALKKTKILAKGFFDYFNIKTQGNYFASYDPGENALLVSIA